jgi:serine/threonine-protein kinase HipA
VASAPATRVEVHVDLPSGETRAGTAFMSVSRRELTTAFDYEPAYWGRADAFDLSPDLTMSGGTLVVPGLPGAMADSAPDRWGRNLINKAVQFRNKEQGHERKSVTEVDYLLGVSDVTRQGAMRYCVDDGPFLAIDNTVPKLLELPRLLNAADVVSREAAGKDEMAAITMLLDAGSGSLGGARPKASVRDGDRLFIAKFPHHRDRWNVMAWEMTALDLAAACGIETPTRRLVNVTGESVLLLERFDRDASRRIPYISAMTLLQTRDGNDGEYIEMAEALQSFGSNVTHDLRELWRRIAFSIAVNNTDDHLRNHGFLYLNGGWCLSPLFDVNPNPDLSEERSTSINYATDHESAKGALVAAAEYFDLDSNSAGEIWDEIIAGVADWRKVATSHGIEDHELRQFAESFESST